MLKSNLLLHIDGTSPVAKDIGRQDIAIATMGPIQRLPNYNWFRCRTYLLRYSDYLSLFAAPISVNLFIGSYVLGQDFIELSSMNKQCDILLQLFTYGRRIAFVELCARIDVVDASTIKRVANRFIFDHVYLKSFGHTTIPANLGNRVFDMGICMLIGHRNSNHGTNPAFAQL
ncbi:unnamed protein product [Ilex paraguariensis]|uniref:Uncharacterized protein n=1 Tax=Ilex paraguariensis TaxID=185542 RepID=A0ABC8SYM0_9AQUA